MIERISRGEDCVICVEICEISWETLSFIIPFFKRFRLLGILVDVEQIKALQSICGVVCLHLGMLELLDGFLIVHGLRNGLAIIIF